MRLPAPPHSPNCAGLEPASGAPRIVAKMMAAGPRHIVGIMASEALQFARRCLFCGEPHVTKTHTLARQYTSMFERDGHKSEVRHDRTDPVTGETVLLKRASTFAHKPKAACQHCNGGWMRELEDAVHPVLDGFAAGRPMVLNAREQERLAMWALVALLVHFEMEPEELRFADLASARDLHRLQIVPPGSQVWLGANDHGEMAWLGTHSLRLVDGDETTRAWGASLSFGYANIHVMHHGLHDRLLCLRGRAHYLLTRIHPSVPGVRWPPRGVISDRDLTPLAQMINDESAFRAV